MSKCIEEAVLGEMFCTWICKFFNISGISQNKLFFLKIDFNGDRECIENSYCQYF